MLKKRTDVEDRLPQHRRRTSGPQLEDFGEAVAYTPAGLRSVGVDVSAAALHRWRLNGIKGVRPETHMRGGRRFITKAALARFFADTTRAAEPIKRSRTPVDRSSAAAAELESEGL